MALARGRPHRWKLAWHWIRIPATDMAGMACEKKRPTLWARRFFVQVPLLRERPVTLQR